MPVHCRSMSWDQGIFIAELNIEHCRTKLTGQLDEGQRQTITTLLAEEEARLFDLKAVAAERELSAFIALLARRAPAGIRATRGRAASRIARSRTPAAAHGIAASERVSVWRDDRYPCVIACRITIALKTIA